VSEEEENQNQKEEKDRIKEGRQKRCEKAAMEK
jgi:hypothetical protein